MSRCLMSEWNTWLELNAKPDRLSQWSEGGFDKNWWMSLNTDRIQNTSTTQWANALYSTSVELLETVGCFFDCHEIGLDPRYTTKPEIDLLELISATQSESK